MILLLVYFGIYFGVFAGLLFLLIFRKPGTKTVGILPQKVNVSILIAARNEAHSIRRCLQSVLDLDYPQHCLEVLIGDDNSSDNTYDIISDFIAGKPNFRLFRISQNLGQARGKANVFAHLARAATSEYFFTTDADIALPRTWITAMLAELEPETGVVTGVTTVTGTRFFARMQGLEWLHNLGLIQVVSSLKLPVTAMGNNMLVTRKAYFSTGGYEDLPFSVTEDLLLFQEILAKGFGFKNVFRKEVLAYTLPAPRLPDLLQQRKRWMQGASHLPLYMRLVLVLYATFYAAVLPLFFGAPAWFGLSILGLKWICQSIFLQICLKRLDRRASVIDLVLYEAFQIGMAGLILVFYLLPIRVRWKGRKY